MAEYTSKFDNLSIQVSLYESSEQMTSRYLADLNSSIRDEMCVVSWFNLQDA